VQKENYLHDVTEFRDRQVKETSNDERTSQNTRAPTAPRTRLLANLVGAVGRRFQFACHFGRGRCATALNGNASHCIAGCLNRE